MNDMTTAMAYSLRAALAQIGAALDGNVTADGRLANTTWSEAQHEMLNLVGSSPAAQVVIEKLASYVQLTTMPTPFNNDRLNTLIGDGRLVILKVTAADFEEALEQALQGEGMRMEDLTDGQIRLIYSRFEGEIAERESVLDGAVRMILSDSSYQSARIYRRLVGVFERAGLDPDERVSEDITWRDVAERMAWAAAQYKINFWTMPLELLLQYMAITAVDGTTVTSTDYYQRQALYKALEDPQMEVDRQSMLARLDRSSLALATEIHSMAIWEGDFCHE